MQNGKDVRIQKILESWIVSLSEAAIMNEISKPEEERLSRPELARRILVALFLFAVMVVVVVDTAPPMLPGASEAKAMLHPLLNYSGLWQGRWTLFAPNPKINNSWISADVYQPDGQLKETWNSTYWPETEGWERFLGFRHINYNNRIHTIDKSAADDLADYLSRKLISPEVTPKLRVELGAASSPTHSSGGKVVVENPWRIVLSRSELNISLPDDGTLPPREETLWLSSSENLTTREYQP